MASMTTKETLSAYALTAGLFTFAVVMASAGIDLRTNIAVPAAAAGFALYSAIAYWVDRRKKTQ